jgi:oxalate decarboxylase/phosphoglucose isomerase-like protein (cupin superfamily)
MAHYVENIGDEPVEMLEVFRASTFRDFSLEQWLAQTPRTMVVGHLNLNGGNAKSFIDSPSKEKISARPARRDSFSL